MPTLDDMQPHDASEPYSPAERTYAAWRLQAEAQGSTESFEALCAAHAELADELRALHADHGVLGGLARAAGVGTIEDERVLRAQAAQARQDLARLGAVGGRYEIGKELGRGGMGSVHEARDLLLERVVACKRIADPAAAARLLPLFRREMRIAARLSHAAVAGIHDAGVDADGRAYFTMPLIRGRNLSEVYRQVARGEEGWSVVRVVAILSQVAEAMAYVHAQGVVHRDLKPGNIRVGEYGEVHVMDWGIAKLADDVAGGAESGAPRQAENSGGAGTPPYMSPEQWRSGGVVGPASDVYALGVMLYELLAGRPPFHEAGEERIQTAVLWRRMQAGPPEPIQTVARAQPAELCSICEKAMERDRDRRYPDCSALAADLRAFLEGRVVAAHEAGTWAETRKWVRRNKALASAVGAAIVASLIGVLAFQDKADEADANARTALIERDRANEQAQLATAQKRLAEERGAAVSRQAQELQLRLLGSQARGLLDALKDASSPWTSVQWTDFARQLVEGSVDPHGAHSPGLAEVRARLAALRATASFKPYSDYDQSRDFINHPLQQAVAKLQLEREELETTMNSAVNQLDRKAEWQARMLGSKPWPDKERYERSMARELEGMRAADLMRQALIYAKPASRRIHGMEVRALIYAERAASSVEPADRVEAEVAWSWALWAVGRGAEALDKLESLRDQLPPADRGPVAEDLLLMQLETARFTGDARAEREAELLAWKAEAKARRKNIKTEIATAEADLDRRITDLQAQCRERRTWRFLDPAEDALHAQFQATEAELVALATVLDHAQEDEVRRRWSAGLQAIAASPKYAQARWPSGGLVQQLGLVPLGEDPHSGLWEFLHAGSGLPPARGDDGEWIIDGETGLVFVLVPGGRTPRLVLPKGTANHQDEWVAEFELDPYFLSKYELTVGQWKRLAGASAAVASSDPTSIAGDMPSQQPSWSEYAELLQRVPGPIWFPSRLQWEHAMRAGTNTMYWTGDSVDSLRGKENIKFDGVRGSLLPVGSLAANPYGFHDIIGSLVEMCGDAGATDDETAISEWVDKIPPRPGDGMKLVDAATHRLTVGSAYWTGPNGMQVAMELDPNEREGGATLRPAMRVLP